ncbi:MAG TPA: hypothetical protein VKS24_13030 [Bradyrhizobium sp.]|nr:hypothetical protein [Bradyrhizobium sp.]
MIEKAATQRSVVSEALAVAFGIMILIGIAYLTHQRPAPTVQADVNHAVAGTSGGTELPAPDPRLWRLHLVLG